MKFVYYYKTSDGVRRKGEIGAANKEEVFATLRQQGIRPIKVELPGGAKIETVWKRRLLVSVALVLLVGIGIGFALRRESVPETPSAADVSAREAFDRLKRKAYALRDAHSAVMRLVDWEMVYDYKALASAKGVAAARNQLRKARLRIAETRSEMRTVFDELYAAIPAESEDLRTEAQVIYGEVMNEVDTDEIRVESGDQMIAELERSSDRKDALTSRWRKDFGTVESNVIEIRGADKPK